MHFIFMCFQKIVIQKVWRTYLHSSYGKLNESILDQTIVYFVRTFSDMVPLPNSLADAETTLPAMFEMGVLNSHALVMLEQILSQVISLS